MATVGEFIAAVSMVAEVRPATMAGNARAFRRIVADVLGVKATPSRYAPCGEGRNDWLNAVHAVSLDQITPDKVQSWKLALVTKAGRDESKARMARQLGEYDYSYGAESFSENEFFALCQRSLFFHLPCHLRGLNSTPGSRCDTRAV